MATAPMIVEFGIIDPKILPWIPPNGWLDLPKQAHHSLPLAKATLGAVAVYHTDVGHLTPFEYPKRTGIGRPPVECLWYADVHFALQVFRKIASKPDLLVHDVAVLERARKPMIYLGEGKLAVSQFDFPISS